MDGESSNRRIVEGKVEQPDIGETPPNRPRGPLPIMRSRSGKVTAPPTEP